MKQFMSRFPRFYAYNFNMRNYMDYSFQDHQLVNLPDSLATVQFSHYAGGNSPNGLYQQKYNCAACVVNNDRYQGGGTHWMAIFVDARKPPVASVEFFNSAGSDPIPEFVSYLVKTKRQIIQESTITDHRKWSAEIVKVTRRRHQQSKTECGVYSLFYIWARLNGVSYQYFLDTPVSDQLMFEFRHHLFAGPDSAIGTKFDWKEFSKRVSVEWE